MKIYPLAIGLVLLTNSISAQIRTENLPSAPPPYGAYVRDEVHWPKDKIDATNLAIARHYGYTDAREARRSCAKVRSDCWDFVRHRRDEMARDELQQFGMKDWDDAVGRCVKNQQRGDLAHCTVDPFLKLRTKK